MGGESATFVNDENLGAQPARGGLLVFLDPRYEILQGLCAYADTGKGVDGDTSHVAGSDSWNEDGVRLAPQHETALRDSYLWKQ